MPLEPFIGELAIFAGDFAPHGWALCNGQVLEIKGHETLFSILGWAYGGDGKTTFALPDLRGRVVVQCTNGSNPPSSVIPRTPGPGGGNEADSIPPQPLPQHTHTATFSGGNMSPLSVEVAVSKNMGNRIDPDRNLLAVYRSTPSANPGNLYLSNPDAWSTEKLGGVRASGAGIVPMGKVKIDHAGQQSVLNTPLKIMQPWLALNYIIATTGFYPSRP